MNVLRLSGGLDPAMGGPSVTSVNSAIAAARAGITTTFAFADALDLSAAAPATLAALEHAGVLVRRFPLVRWPGRTARRWGVSPALGRWAIAAARDYHVIHLHGAWQFLAPAALIARRRGARIVLTPHESLTDFDIRQTPSPVMRGFKRALRPLLLRGFDRVVAASALEARDSVPPGLKQLVRPAVVHHAVFDERAERRAPAARPLEKARITAGFIGRFHPKKNLEVAIRAVAGLSDGVRLMVAGDGPADYALALKALARDSGAGARVEWLGFVSGAAKESFFDHIDVLLMPSEYECFGMAAAEALVRGVPVILTPETGVADAVALHGCGEIVAADPAAIAQVLRRLLHEPERLAHYAGRASRAAQAEFSFAAHGAALRAVYDSVLA